MVMLSPLSSQWYRGAYEDAVWLFFSYLDAGKEDKIDHLYILDNIKYWLDQFSKASERERDEQNRR